MDKNKICEALYALPGRIVVRRRRIPFVPGLVALAGAAMIVANSFWAADLTDNVRSALVFVGGVLLFIGAGMLCARLFGRSGVPFHPASKRFLRYEEWYFELKDKPEVMRCVEKGDVRGLRALTRSRIPSLAVAVYAVPDGGFAAVQAFEYADLEYRSLSGLKIVDE